MLLAGTVMALALAGPDPLAAPGPTSRPVVRVVLPRAATTQLHRIVFQPFPSDRQVEISIEGTARPAWKVDLPASDRTTYIVMEPGKPPVRVVDSGWPVWRARFPAPAATRPQVLHFAPTPTTRRVEIVFEGVRRPPIVIDVPASDRKQHYRLEPGKPPVPIAADQEANSDGVLHVELASQPERVPPRMPARPRPGERFTGWESTLELQQRAGEDGEAFAVAHELAQRSTEGALALLHLIAFHPHMMVRATALNRLAA